MSTAEEVLQQLRELHGKLLEKHNDEPPEGARDWPAYWHEVAELQNELAWEWGAVSKLKLAEGAEGDLLQWAARIAGLGFRDSAEESRAKARQAQPPS